MNYNSKQWSGTFGKDYIDRNSETPYELDEFYKDMYGVSRTEMNLEFLQEIPKESSFFECGCNIGTQIELLKYIGYNNNEGIEINEAAWRIADRKIGGNIICDDFLELTLHEKYDVVYTSGVLIHIPPMNREKFIKKMIESSRKYLWIFEYYASSFEDVKYRGKLGMMWRGPFTQIFLKNGCKTIKNKLYKRKDGNVDIMCLMEKV